MPTSPSPLETATDLLASHLPTSRHIAMLFDMLLDHLGDLAVVVSEADGGVRRVYRRESPDSANITPWPELVVALGGQITLASPSAPADGADRFDPEPPAAHVPSPRLRGLTSGEVRLHDGAQKIVLRYGEDGVLYDQFSDDDAAGRLAGVGKALAARNAQPVELVAAYLASLAPWRHGPGRVRLPVPVPGGVEGTWEVGLRAARRTVFTGRVPASARFVVADGVAGTAVGWGATRDEAVAAFEAEVRRAQPRPTWEIHTATDDYDDEGNLIARGEPILLPDPDAAPHSPFGGLERIGEPTFDTEPDDLPFGTFMLRGPTPDAAMPALSIETTPFVVIPLDPSPAAPPPAGTWARILGRFGATRHAARVDGPTGFTLVAEDVLPHVGPSSLGADLDAIDERHGYSLEESLSINLDSAPYKRFAAVSYRFEPATAKRAAGLVFAEAIDGQRFDPGTLDGERVAGHVWRLTRIPRGSWKPS